MHIVIDAYNLFKQIVQDRHITVQQRTMLVEKLRVYARKKGHTITLIFDGAGDLDQREYREKSVALLYSGYRDTADDVIKHLLERKRQGEILLVTSDRELVSYAQLYAVDTMPSLEFYRLIMHALEPVRPSKSIPEDLTLLKTAEHSTEEVDDLMMSVGLPPVKDEVYTQRHKNTQTPSKKEKEQQRKMKKL